MQTRTFMKTLVAAAIGMALAGAAQAQQWKPTRPINLIVPWAAGGSTDQVTRMAAAEIEKALGQKIVIVNQPGALGLDRHQERAGRAAGRLHLDRRRRAGPGRLPDAGHAQQHDQRLPPVPDVANVRSSSVNPTTPYQTVPAAARRDEGQAGQIRSPPPASLGGPQRDGSDRQGHRRQVPARHLRRRQPRGGGHGGRRNRRHHAARGRAGRDDPRQAPAPAGRGGRPAAGTRRLRHDPADVAVVPGFTEPVNYFGIFIPKGVPDRGGEDAWRRSGPRTSPPAKR